MDGNTDERGKGGRWRRKIRNLSGVILKSIFPRAAFLKAAFPRIVIMCSIVLCGMILLPAGIRRAYGKELSRQYIPVQESVESEPAGQESLDEGVIYTNPETGYQVLVEDRAELLTSQQRQDLARVMERVTVYGHAAFVTVTKTASFVEPLYVTGRGDPALSAGDYARDYYNSRFGTDSGTVFLIDLGRRTIWIHSDGDVYKVVNKAYATTVTDNVYRYASKGDYYGCAMEAFEEISRLLEGQRIARPMKYISNALLALILALLANFGLVIAFARLPEPGTKAVLSGIHRTFRYSEVRAVHTHQSRIYDPVSRSGTGGGRHGGGGGRSGGGRSGGGGGHRF